MRGASGCRGAMQKPRSGGRDMPVDVVAAKHKPISQLTAEERMAIWKSEQSTAGAKNGATPHAQQPDTDPEPIEWGAPQPIPDGLLPVPTMPVALIPTAFRGWLHDIATRLQVP